MTTFIKELLLHFSVILFLAFVYNFAYLQRIKLSGRKLFISTIIFSLVVTMLFPVNFNPNITFDLKFIPFFISFFYGGPMISLGLFGLIMLVELFVATKPIWITLCNYTIIYLIFIFARKKYMKSSVVKKISFGFFIYMLLTITRFIALIQYNSLNVYPYLLVFSLVSFIALALVIYIIEMTNFQLKTLKELQRAEKLHAISQLAASVAHEIRNPMTTIKGFMQLMSNDQNLTQSQNMFISISMKELDRTQTIINNFLMMSKPAKEEKQEINLSFLLNEVVEFMQPYAHISNVNMMTTIRDGLYINGYSAELKQVFINMIKNGVEAIKDSGNMYVIAQKHQNDIIIEIKDEGVGINKKQLKRLGQPYFSTKEKGTGLGLMISYEIIKQLNGKIEVDSIEGEGTVFKIMLPKIND
ncbi:MAG: ATP-binding protein [Bacillota bacterium]